MLSDGAQLTDDISYLMCQTAAAGTGKTLLWEVAADGVKTTAQAYLLCRYLCRILLHIEQKSPEKKVFGLRYDSKQQQCCLLCITCKFPSQHLT